MKEMKWKKWRRKNLNFFSFFFSCGSCQLLSELNILWKRQRRRKWEGTHPSSLCHLVCMDLLACSLWWLDCTTWWTQTSCSCTAPFWQLNLLTRWSTHAVLFLSFPLGVFFGKRKREFWRDGERKGKDKRIAKSRTAPDLLFQDRISFFGNSWKNMPSPLSPRFNL